MSEDYVSQVIEELRKFSDRWNQVLGGDRWKNFRMIEQITNIPAEEQFKLFLAKDLSQILLNPDEVDDSLFDLAMWAILWLAYRRARREQEKRPAYDVNYNPRMNTDICYSK